MTYWQTVPPAYSARLEELARTLTACRDAFHETANDFHWEPAAGSGAARAAATLPSPDPAIATPTTETGHRLIAEALQIFLFTSAAHLGSWAALLRAGGVIASPPLLLRAVIENCAHVVWVVGDDPAEDPEDRLARAYLEELKSAEEAKMNAGRLLGKTDPTHVRTQTAWKKVKADIKAHYPAATSEQLAVFELHGQKLIGLEASVKAMYELTERFGGTVGATVASGMYGLLSNHTHPTLYVVREMRVWTTDPVTGHSVANVTVTIDSVEKDVRAGLAAFYNALNYVTSYFGWPETALRTLEDKIEAVIPDFFTPPVK